MTKILGISAKKQGGKNTSLNYIFGQIMCQIGVVDRFQIDDKGRLVVPAKNAEDQLMMGLFDPLSRDLHVRAFLAEMVDPYVKAYSFADPLKAFLVDVMGLKPEQCYGTDDEKNTSTKFKWADFESVLPPDYFVSSEINKTSYMTGREVMQIFGTDVMRSIYNDIWVDATIRKILDEQPGLAILCDVRFPGEVTKIQNQGGKVIRLRRDPFLGQPDVHSSETALDDFDGFDLLVDNRDVTIPQNNDLVKDALIALFGEEIEL